MKKPNPLKRSIRLAIIIVLAVVIFAYGFQVTQVSFDEIYSPTRQESLTRVIRAISIRILSNSIRFKFLSTILYTLSHWSSRSPGRTMGASSGRRKDPDCGCVSGAWSVYTIAVLLAIMALYLLASLAIAFGKRTRTRAWICRYDGLLCGEFGCYTLNLLIAVVTALIGGGVVSNFLVKLGRRYIVPLPKPTRLAINYPLQLWLLPWLGLLWVRWSIRSAKFIIRSWSSGCRPWLAHF